MPDINDLMPATPDLNAERLDQLKRLMPDLFTADGRLDPEEIKRLVDSEQVAGSERFEFRWFGKADAKRRAFTPTTAALQYDASRSVNPEIADGNMIIEGENLEVLKCLLSAYRERIKCIYIDPPYNTGNDFVYSDNYTEQRRAYWEQTGVTEEGVKVDTNTESDGRYHSNWLNMMYPRLLVARQLLREDGVIFISIDENEGHHLRKLCDEVFGEGNQLASLIWEKTRKNDARFFSVGHEYILVYSKNQHHLRDLGVYWREDKPGAHDIFQKYETLMHDCNGDYQQVEEGLKLFYEELPKGHPAKKHSRYNKVDDRGVWRDDNMSWPGGGGPIYDVIHPDTKKPCKVPPGGWRYSTPEKMQEMIDAGIVVFRDNESEPPIRKTYLVRRVGKPLTGEETIGQQVMGTYFYRSALQASRVLDDLFGQKIFENPKDHEVIKRLISYTTNPHDIVLDFFAGSGTTGHSIMDLNKGGDGARKFILVQLPEKTDEKSEAFKAGFMKVSDITIERNKRVTALIEQGQVPYKPGFKVYRLVKSHFPRVEFQPDPEKTTEENIALLRQYIADKEATLYSLFNEADIFDEVMLKNGFQLHYTREAVDDFTANRVYRVSDGVKTALVCLDSELQETTVATLGGKDEVFICLERAVDTTKKWNLKHQLREKLIAF